MLNYRGVPYMTEVDAAIWMWQTQCHTPLPCSQIAMPLGRCYYACAPTSFSFKPCHMPPEICRTSFLCKCAVIDANFHDLLMSFS